MHFYCSSVSQLDWFFERLVIYRELFFQPPSSIDVQKWNLNNNNNNMSAILVSVGNGKPIYDKIYFCCYWIVGNLNYFKNIILFIVAINTDVLTLSNVTKSLGSGITFSYSTISLIKSRIYYYTLHNIYSNHQGKPNLT